MSGGGNGAVRLYMTIAVRSTDFMSGDGALSAFERNMADDMTRLGTLRRSADDGYVVLHRPADSRTAQALAHPLSAGRLHTNVCY